MNTSHLSRRLNRYSKSKLGSAREDKLVDPIEDIALDEDYVPNPFIVDEIIQESEPAFDYAIPTQMLNDGIEMLRRLDIIKANINYPVSGYRTSLSTLLKADPALESLNLSPTFSRRRLTVAIESNKVDIIVSVLGLIVMLFGKRIAGVFINLRRRLYDKRHNINSMDAHAKLMRAMHSTSTLNWKRWNAAVKTNTPTYFESVEKSKKIVVRDYVKALFDELLKRNTHAIIDSMMSNQKDTAKLVDMANRLPGPVGLFLSDIDDSISKMNSGYIQGKVDSREISENLIADNEDFIKDVREYTELAKLVLGANDVTKKYTFLEFLPAARDLIATGKKLNVKSFLNHEKHTKAISSQLDKVQKIISNLKQSNNPDLINEVQGVILTMRKATDTISSLLVTVDNQSKCIEVLEKCIVDIESHLPVKFAN